MQHVELVGIHQYLAVELQLPQLGVPVPLEIPVMHDANLVHPPHTGELGTDSQKCIDDLGGRPLGVRRMGIAELGGEDPSALRMVLDGIEVSQPGLAGEPPVGQVPRQAGELGVIAKRAIASRFCATASPSGVSRTTGVSDIRSMMRNTVGLTWASC